MPKRFIAGACALFFVGACSSRRPPASTGTPPPHVQEGLASWYGLEEAGREQPHEAGQADQLDAPGLQLRSQDRLEGFAIVVAAMVDDDCLDAGFPRPLQALGVRSV